MSEKNLRKRVLDYLKPLRGFAVENVVLDGTPDICCTLGWIELKYLDDWPKRANTGVDFGIRPAQVIWHHGWRKAGGRSFFLCQVAREYMLFGGYDGSFLAAKPTKEALISAALQHWTTWIDLPGTKTSLELIRCL